MGAQFKFIVKTHCLITVGDRQINLRPDDMLSVVQLAPSSHPDDCWLLELCPSLIAGSPDVKIRHLVVANEQFDWLRRRLMIAPVEGDI